MHVQTRMDYILEAMPDEADEADDDTAEVLESFLVDIPCMGDDHADLVRLSLLSLSLFATLPRSFFSVHLDRCDFIDFSR